MLAARTHHRTHLNNNSNDMQRDEPHDSDAHNTLLHNKQANNTRALATRLSTTLHRYLTPLRCLTITLSFLLLLTIRHYYSSPTAPTHPLPLTCCPHTSYHRRLQIVTVGDSITEYGSRQGGWVSLMSTHYVRHADLYNRGYGGYNTRTYLALLHQHINHNTWPYQPTTADDDDSSKVTRRSWQRLVTLYLGTNDAALPHSATNESRIHTPLDEFQSNLRSIVALLVPQYGAYLSADTVSPSRYLSRHTALILITPGQLNITAWQLRSLTPPYPPTSSLPVSRSLSNTANYAAAVQSVANEWHIPCLDLWSLTPDSEWQRLLSDGLHLTEAGNRVVYDGVMRLVRENYGELEVSGMEEEEEDEVGKLEWDAPVYWQIDYRDIAGSFAVKDAAA